MTLADAIANTLSKGVAKLARDLATDLVLYEANRLEADDSPLCTCTPNTLHAPRTTTGHQCDCPAVTAAGIVLAGLTPTLHAEQCTGCTP
jgi:hypothetical protein